MPVTHAEIVNAKPREKPYRLFDGRGLYLEVAPSGGRWWRFKVSANYAAYGLRDESVQS